VAIRCRLLPEARTLLPLPSGCVPSGARSCRTSTRASAQRGACRPQRWPGSRPQRRLRCSPRSCCPAGPIQASGPQPGPTGPLRASMVRSAIRPPRLPRAYPGRASARAATPAPPGPLARLSRPTRDDGRAAADGGPDQPEQQFVAPYQAGRRPGGDNGTDRPGRAAGAGPRAGPPSTTRTPTRTADHARTQARPARPKRNPSLQKMWSNPA
jgi:hypothetical protein